MVCLLAELGLLQLGWWFAKCEVLPRLGLAKRGGRDVAPQYGRGSSEGSVSMVGLAIRFLLRFATYSALVRTSPGVRPNNWVVTTV